MARFGTDWKTFALLGVSAVVAYELLGKAAKSPAPAGTTRTAPATPQAAAKTTQVAAPAQIVTSAQKLQTEQGEDVSRSSAATIMPRTEFGTSVAASRFLATHEARLQAADVIAQLPTTASRPTPKAQPADQATYLPTGTDYGSLANVQSQLSQTIYSTNQTPVDQQSTDMTVYADQGDQQSTDMTVYADQGDQQSTDMTVYADQGDQSRRRLGGVQE